MVPTCLNHMTMPGASTIAVLDAAKALGCVGVELRNDLSAPLFDGGSPTSVRDAAQNRSLRILALAQVYGFNDNSPESRGQVQELIALAQDCGAEAIALIPRVEDAPLDRQIQRDRLRVALDALQPMFKDTGITGLIEPLGFTNSSLRHKSDVQAVLRDMENADCFALIHDTFHHALAGETDFFADMTRIVHISGVTDQALAFDDLTDAHRGLVDAHDRLGNVEQLLELRAQGYRGPLSFEAFSPEVHALADPAADLSASTAFITAQITQRET